MWLSITLGNSKVLKSKGQVLSQFLSKSDNSSSDWRTTVQQYWRTNILVLYFPKNEAFIVKKLNGVSGKLQFCTQLLLNYPLRRPQDIIYFPKAVTNIFQTLICCLINGGVCFFFVNWNIDKHLSRNKQMNSHLTCVLLEARTRADCADNLLNF